MEIKNLDIFHNLSELEIEKSLHCSKSEVVSYKKGTYIFQPDEIPKQWYVVLSGEVVVNQINGHGKQTYTEYLSENDCFGEMELFMNKQSYTYSAEAKTDVELLAIPKHFFAGVCENHCRHHNQVTSNMLYIFAKVAERNAVRMQLLTYGTLRQRLVYYIQSKRKGRKLIKMQMNREELAVYLNTARPVLSREFSLLQQQGIIKTEGRYHIRILDAEALENEVRGIK